MKARAVRTHERLVGDEVVSGSSNRSFGFTFAIVFTIVALWPLVRGRSVRGWALIAAAAFLLAALALPRVLAPLSQLWLKLGLFLIIAVWFSLLPRVSWHEKTNFFINAGTTNFGSDRVLLNTRAASTATR